MSGRNEHCGGSVSEEAETTLRPLDFRLLAARAVLLLSYKCEYQVGDLTNSRPSCWDGIEAADGNYSPHVRYPTDAPNGHICPPDFPKKLMTVQFETNFAVGDLPFHGEEEVTWVLANGDTTGVSRFL